MTNLRSSVCSSPAHLYKVLVLLSPQELREDTDRKRRGKKPNEERDRRKRGIDADVFPAQ